MCVPAGRAGGWPQEKDCHAVTFQRPASAHPGRVRRFPGMLSQRSTRRVFFSLARDLRNPWLFTVAALVVAHAVADQSCADLLFGPVHLADGVTALTTARGSMCWPECAGSPQLRCCSTREGCISQPIVFTGRETSSGFRDPVRNLARGGIEIIENLPRCLNVLCRRLPPPGLAWISCAGPLC